MSLLLARRGVVAARSAGGGGGGGDPTPIYTATFTAAGFDGLFNAMGTDDGALAFENPATSAARAETYAASQSTTNSTLTADKATDQANVSSSDEAHTTNVPSSLWTADFGADRAVKLTHYGILGRSADGLYPRNWKLQGSNDGTLWEDLDVQAANTAVGASTWFSGTVSSTQWWRYIRIVAKGLNSNDASFGGYLILGDVELWGELGDATGLTLPGPDPLPTGTVADRAWTANTITDGIFDALGTDNDTDDFIQPHGKTTGIGGYTVSASSELEAARSAEKATNRFPSPEFHSTNATASEWWQADFGAGRALTVTHYAIQGRDAAGQYPRNWKLQGSNDGTAWTDLDTQTANADINRRTWFSAAIVGASAYRYLRILQTGANSSGADYLVLGQVEFWGALTE